MRPRCSLRVEWLSVCCYTHHAATGHAAGTGQDPGSPLTARSPTNPANTQYGTRSRPGIQNIDALVKQPRTFKTSHETQPDTKTPQSTLANNPHTHPKTSSKNTHGTQHSNAPCMNTHLAPAPRTAPPPPAPATAASHNTAQTPPRTKPRAARPRS